MRVVFAGTPEFSVPALRALIALSSAELVAVYTQPDRPAGRGRKRRTSPIKCLATKHGLTVYQPESFKQPAVVEHFATLNADLMVVVAYGLLLPAAVLQIPPLGCVNVHASLLPRWRGAAPIQRAIEAGDHMTGITLMQMQPRLDSGAILAYSATEIGTQETGGSLHDKLSLLGAELLINNWNEICQQTLDAVAQDDRLVTYADKLSKTEAALDWTQSASKLERKVRAFNPSPLSTAKLGDMTLRIITATHINNQNETQNKDKIGQVLNADNSGIVIQTGHGQINVKRLQKPGGKALDVADFLNGLPITKGMVLR